MAKLEYLITDIVSPSKVKAIKKIMKLFKKAHKIEQKHLK